MTSAVGVALSGCASAPKDVEAINRIRSVTIVCCDFKDEVNVLPETKMTMVVGVAGALTGGVLGAVAASSVAGGVSLSRTWNFYRAAGESPLSLHKPFVDEVRAALSLRNVASTALVPRGFDGFQNKYVIDPSETSGDAILELRYIGNIANTDDRFFPSIAVSYRLLRATDRKELTRGLVASSDPGVTVAFGDRTPFSAPSIGPLRQGAGDLSNTGTLLDLPSDRVVVGDTDVLNASAKKMYSDVIATNREVALRLANVALSP